MSNVMEALRTLAPGAEWSTDGTSITEWFSPDIPQPTQDEIDAEIARLQAEYDSKAYARARAEAYAPIADQLDMQYWDSVNGSRTWLDHIEAVKEAHPK
jgi:hypothetical protein